MNNSKSSQIVIDNTLVFIKVIILMRENEIVIDHD